MQAQFLDVLQQGATDAVDDALGHARGAAGIEDVQRLLEGHRGELRFTAGLVEVLPQGDASGAAEVACPGRRVGVGHHHQLLQRGQALKDFVELAGQVEVLAGIAITGGGDQHLGFDLA